MYGVWKVKMSLEGKSGGGSIKGRPRLQWMDDAELDLRNVGVKIWGKKSFGRN
jgi:hypothetical protein